MPERVLRREQQVHDRRRERDDRKEDVADDDLENDRIVFERRVTVPSRLRSDAHQHVALHADGLLRDDAATQAHHAVFVDVLLLRQADGALVGDELRRRSAARLVETVVLHEIHGRETLERTFLGDLHAGQRAFEPLAHLVVPDEHVRDALVEQQRLQREVRGEHEVRLRERKLVRVRTDRRTGERPRHRVRERLHAERQRERHVGVRDVRRVHDDRPEQRVDREVFHRLLDLDLRVVDFTRDRAGSIGLHLAGTTVRQEDATALDLLVDLDVRERGDLASARHLDERLARGIRSADRGERLRVADLVPLEVLRITVRIRPEKTLADLVPLVVLEQGHETIDVADAERFDVCAQFLSLLSPRVTIWLQSSWA